MRATSASRTRRAASWRNCGACRRTGKRRSASSPCSKRRRRRGKEEAETERTRLLEQLSSSEESTTGKLVEIERQRDTKADERKLVGAKIPKNVLSRYEDDSQAQGALRLRRRTTACAWHAVWRFPPQLFQRVLRDEGLELCPPLPADSVLQGRLLRRTRPNTRNEHR